MTKKIGVVLIAHGSRRRESNTEFIQLCEKIKIENVSKFDLIEYAFLEFEEPTIELAVKNMYDNSVEKVYIYPYFLNSGKHVSVDIPDKLAKLQSTYANIELEILNHFGASKSVVSIISADLQELN